MTRVLELSIFSFISLILTSAGAGPVPLISAASSAPNLEFLSQAEDIEREAWWIITNTRLDGASSPFRVFRAASIMAGETKGPKQKQQKTKISFKFCRSLQVQPRQSPPNRLGQPGNMWIIESACQKPNTELGRVTQTSLNPQKWEIVWKTSPFSDHVGLTTGILFNQVSCQLELDQKGKLSRLSCPNYVRDRKPSEVVEFKVLEYTAQAPQVLKIEGDIKKELQVIATFKSDVPLAGDIVLKVKKIPQKPVEEKTEFSNMKPANTNPPTPSRGESYGKKETDKENNEESSNEGSQKTNQEKRYHNESDPEGQFQENRNSYEGRDKIEPGRKVPPNGQGQSENQRPESDAYEEQRSEYPEGEPIERPAEVPPIAPSR